MVVAVGAAAVLAAVVALADRGTLATAATTTLRQPLPLAAALAAYTAGFVLRAAAWGPLLPVPVPLSQRLRAVLAALAVNHALPGPVGEAARANAVCGDGLSFRRALLSVVAARVVDVGCLAVLVMGAAFVAGESPGWVRSAAPLAALLPFAVLAVARWRGAVLDRRSAMKVGVLALPSWALEAGVVLAVASAAGLPLSAAGAVLATGAGVLAQVAAVLPGGIGTYEAGVTSALVALGAPVDEALAVAAATHGVKFVYAFAAGVPALVWSPGALRRRGVAVATP